MGKLLDYANIGVDLYQTKQLASIAGAQHELNMAHMMESIRGDMEVEKRKLMMQFETELEQLSFTPNPVQGVAKVAQIRSATNTLDLTTSGFREFADMDRAKSFYALLANAESKMNSEVSAECIRDGRLVHQYVMEDDDLEEYAALQYVKEAEDEEMSLSMKAMGWLFVAGLLGMILAIGIGYVAGDAYAVNMIDSESSEYAEVTDLFLGLFCGGSIVLMIALWKPFGMTVTNVTALFSTSAMDEAKKILKNGGGQEALDGHIENFGEMTSDEVIAKRIRRLEFVGQHTG